MPVNAVAENVFGTLGTVCWMVQLFPQIYKSYREKNSVGLSELMILSWALGGVFLGIYAVVQDLNIPLIMQPQIFGTLSVICWAQCQYYRRRWSRLKTILVGISVGCVLGGFEAGMVYALRSSYNHGNQRAESAIFFFGIMSTVVISGALLPQYYQIYKHKEVIGLSIACMTIDLLGGVFSDLSLIFRPGSFNVLAGVTYTLVVVTDGVVILAAIILNPRARRRRQREREIPPNADQPFAAKNDTVLSSPSLLVAVIDDKGVEN
ncbi:PQ loop repeat-domain-containing protein [Lentinula aciculospora]|uniref:PQ loop repeat-domain-containing protein n=1 Tax=Lentinula aciculospora TaxID=153920 RepID=A0A9W9AEK1_9AGAR|nr:PQ loop repeat-domain-containing protein [Lentinula aciculospora]